MDSACLKHHGGLHALLSTGLGNLLRNGHPILPTPCLYDFKLCIKEQIIFMAYLALSCQPAPAVPDHAPGPCATGPLFMPSPSCLLLAVFLPCFTLPLLLTAGGHKPEDRPTAHCHCNANFSLTLSRKAEDREDHRYLLLPHSSSGHPDWLPLSKLGHSHHQKRFSVLADGWSCWGRQHQGEGEGGRGEGGH